MCPSYIFLITEKKKRKKKKEVIRDRHTLINNVKHMYTHMYIVGKGRNRKEEKRDVDI
jgi:hypothetical protein